MRIMFVIPSMAGGGAERVAANLCNYWCSENDVRIVSIVSDKSFYDLDRRVEHCGQNLMINRKNSFSTLRCYIKYFSKSIKFIKKNINEFKPNCVISFLVETDILTYLAAKRNKDVLRVFSERNDPTRRNKVKQIILKNIYKTSDMFVCQSKKIFDYYSCIPADKKVIIPNMLDDVVLPKPELNENNHNIVSVGRLFEQKNFKLLVKSFLMSVDKLPEDSKLVIYGDGPLKEELQTMIDGEKKRNRIELVGASKNVLDMIKSSALFVLSSDYEGFPNVLLEAMAVGLPVISTDFYTGVAKELIKKRNGILVPVGDANAMSNAIVKIMNSDGERKKMRRNNISVRDRYNVKMIGDLWLTNFSRLMDKER
ncbi:glycosyltransferase [Candidatus Saccharibacteria bacterium]|nr:glycosyltransferase [Candidatus Saccharibacteria bacterium]